MSQLYLTHNANVVDALSPVPAFNIKNGCSKQESDTTPGEYIFIPKMADGQLASESESGYTQIFDWTFQPKVFPNLDAKLTLPILGELSFQEMLDHPELYGKFWLDIIDANQIKDIAVYPIKPAGKCFNKNIKFYKIPVVLNDNDEPILNDNDEYIIV